MSFIQKSIVVSAPASLVYDQWTRFEEFPLFMEGIESVRQLDESHLQWEAKLGGKSIRWTAEIRERVPERRIAWESTSGAKNHGRVLFEPLEGGSTRITLEVAVEPAGWLESIGEAFGVVSHRVEEDLKRFKAYIENRGVGSGVWPEPADARVLPMDAPLPPIL